MDFLFIKDKNKSLSSKNDEFLRLVTSDYEKKYELLEYAQRKCNYKVVIKNNKNKSTITKVSPDYSIKTKLVKYDIFLKK